MKVKRCLGTRRRYVYTLTLSVRGTPGTTETTNGYGGTPSTTTPEELLALQRPESGRGNAGEQAIQCAIAAVERDRLLDPASWPTMPPREELLQKGGSTSFEQINLENVLDIRMHPEYKKFMHELFSIMRNPELRKKIISWGEIGLDYSHKVMETFYCDAIKIAMRQGFVDHIRLATFFGLPMQVHARQAERDTMGIFIDHLPKDARFHVGGF